MESRLMHIFLSFCLSLVAVPLVFFTLVGAQLFSRDGILAGRPSTVADAHIITVATSPIPAARSLPSVAMPRVVLRLQSEANIHSLPPSTPPPVAQAPMTVTTSPRRSQLPRPVKVKPVASPPPTPKRSLLPRPAGQVKPVPCKLLASPAQHPVATLSPRKPVAIPAKHAVATSLPCKPRASPAKHTVVTSLPRKSVTMQVKQTVSTPSSRKPSVMPTTPKHTVSTADLPLTPVAGPQDPVATSPPSPPLYRTQFGTPRLAVLFYDTPTKASTSGWLHERFGPSRMPLWTPSTPPRPCASPWSSKLPKAVGIPPPKPALKPKKLKGILWDVCVNRPRSLRPPCEKTVSWSKKPDQVVRFEKWSWPEFFFDERIQTQSTS